LYKNWLQASIIMNSKTTSDHTESPSCASDGKNTQPLSGGRLWLIRTITFVLIPVLFFGLLELSLWLSGFGYSTSYFKHSEIKGEDFLVPNSYFSYRFFPPALARRPLELRMAAEKPADTYRIFIFGESAAYGDPDPAYGVGRHLEVLLRERFPGTSFEVVNTAMTAINSHAILPIAREVAQLDADLWIVYMGNNEMIGAFGPGTVFSSKAPSLAMVRAILAVKSTRTGQFMESLLSGLQKDDKTSEKWDGINMFSKNLGYDDPGRLVAYNNFRGNLKDILDAAVGAQVPVLLSTVGSNLQQTAPFNSMHPEGFEAAQLSEWTSHYSQGVALEAQGSCAEALEQYSLAAAIDSGQAELQFRMGRCYLQMGNPELALAAYTKARDHDGLAVRADTRINKIIRDSAELHTDDQVKLVDAEKLLAANSPGGITGRELFYEHVHFTFNGNYRLARILAKEVAMKLPSNITATDKGHWVDANISSDELALTIWDQYKLWTDMSPRLSAPPHQGTLNYKANIAYSKARAKEVVSRIDLKKTPKQDRELYLRAIAKSPGDNWLHTHFAQYLAGNGDLSASISELKVVCELLPDLEWPHYFLGQHLGRAKRYDEATESFKRALEIRSDFTLAQQGLDKINSLKR
jgi:tetratricopeptide (TPR) repeat protein